MDEDLTFNILRPNDFYLTPICLIVLYVFAFIMKKKYKGHPLQKYIVPALTLRFISAIIYVLIIKYYYGISDSYTYYQGVLDLHRAVSNDLSFLKDIYTTLDLQPTDRIYPYFKFDPLGYTHYYMLESRNYTVSRFGLPFSLVFNRSFLCISFCISYFAFLGCWKLSLLFYGMYPHLHKKIAYATLFMPSILFWGVSLMKDPICLGAMGYFLYAAHDVFIRKRKIIHSAIVLFLSGFLIYNLKPYIIISLSGVFVLWIFLRFREKISDRTLRSVSTLLFAGMAIIGGFFVVQSLAKSDLTKEYSSERILSTIEAKQSNFLQNKTGEEGGLSNFEVGSTGNSLLGLVSLVPLGIINTYFRPFLWDVSSPMMIFSALESLCFLVITIQCFRRVGMKETFSKIFSDPVIAFCFVFAILFGGIIGITTTNFGALVRYKIPCIPFYAMAFFLVMDKSKKFSPNYVFSKKLF